MKHGVPIQVGVIASSTQGQAQMSAIGKAMAELNASARSEAERQSKAPLYRLGRFFGGAWAAFYRDADDFAAGFRDAS